MARRALDRAPWPEATTTLVSGRALKNRRQRGTALAHAIGIGRQAEIERDHRWLKAAQRLQRGFPTADDDHTTLFMGPPQLGLQLLVVLGDQQFGQSGHCAATACGTAATRSTRQKCAAGAFAAFNFQATAE